MNKFILKLFDNIKYLFEFGQIVMLFGILILLLYWIQNLISAHWAWMKFFTPVLVSLVDTGKSIWDGSINLFGAVFEYKYFVALIILFVCMYVFKILLQLNNCLRNFYIDKRLEYKKHEEKKFNNMLEQNNTNELKKMKKYYVYIVTSPKKINYLADAINMDEQNKIMNKFLIQQFGFQPQKVEQGFLYEFSDFEKIDDTVGVLFRVIKSTAPIDYNICIDIANNRLEASINRLLYISSLQQQNKIVITSEGVWRYNGNVVKKYNTSQIGLFKKNNDTYELHEFLENE
ncbi:MAG: hypothetical protein MJ231_05170 [bacterium]|nr:hypothetical protein [bacterium]